MMDRGESRYSDGEGRRDTGGRGQEHFKRVAGLCSHSQCPCASQAINRAMQKPQEEYSIGVLDIYGFEIFQV